MMVDNRFFSGLITVIVSPNSPQPKNRNVRVPSFLFGGLVIGGRDYNLCVHLWANDSSCMLMLFSVIFGHNSGFLQVFAWGSKNVNISPNMLNIGTRLVNNRLALRTCFMACNHEIRMG